VQRYLFYAWISSVNLLHSEFVKMGIILGIDFGLKRSGLAITDDLKMIGSPLETVETKHLFTKLEELLTQKEVEGIVVGMPMGLDNKSTDATGHVIDFIEKLKNKFSKMKVWTVDERFTSKIAKQTMIYGNLPKMKRRNKGIIDKISAAIILQSFLDR